jgi:hypothetical protein
MTASYPPPLDQLLALGQPASPWAAWRDYFELGVTEEHVADLLRMFSDPALNGDDADEAAFWAPVHAARALGQLGAEAAAAPLAERLATDPEDEWLQNDLPRALGLIGQAAIAAVEPFITLDHEHEFSRFGAMLTLVRVAAAHPRLEDDAFGVLVRKLEGWADQDPRFNGELIAAMLGAGYAPAAPLMEAAYAGGAVDESVAGDWEDAQVALELLPERTTPRRPFYLDGTRREPPARPAAARSGPPAVKKQGKPKAQRKAAREARKRNRRK